MVLIVCFGLASNFHRMFAAALDLRGVVLGRDQMSVFGARLTEIQRDLPSYGQVGYISDTSDNLGDYPDQELIWTRYYLAPLLVSPNLHYHLVIGNFHGPLPTKSLADWHLVLVREYGNGIMLFRESGQ